MKLFLEKGRVISENILKGVAEDISKSEQTNYTVRLVNINKNISYLLGFHSKRYTINITGISYSKLEMYSAPFHQILFSKFFFCLS